MVGAHPTETGRPPGHKEGALVPTDEPTPGELLEVALQFTAAWRRLLATVVLAGRIPNQTVMLAFAVAYDWTSEELIDPSGQGPEPPEAA
jgi:hypothetical protein